MGKRGRPVGYRMSEQSKKQIAESKRGQKHNRKTKDKIAKSLVKYFDEVGRVDNSGEVRCESCGGFFTTPNKYYPNKYCDNCKHDPWYRGGVSEEYREFYQRISGLVVYQQWREAVLYRDKYRCQHCGKKARSVHHTVDILLLKDDCDALFNPNIGLTLCVSCHAREHARIKKEWRKNND